MSKTTAYRGYLIKETMHGFCIEKDGFLICWIDPRIESEKTSPREFDAVIDQWAKTLEHAKTMIDGLLDPE